MAPMISIASGSESTPGASSVSARSSRSAGRSSRNSGRVAIRCGRRAQHHLVGAVHQSFASTTWPRPTARAAERRSRASGNHASGRAAAAPGRTRSFSGPNGGPLRHKLFYRRHFQPAVRAALPASKHGLRFHDLRHTCASLLIAAGAHSKAIQVAALGWLSRLTEEGGSEQHVSVCRT